MVSAVAPFFFFFPQLGIRFSRRHDSLLLSQRLGQNYRGPSPFLLSPSSTERQGLPLSLLPFCAPHSMETRRPLSPFTEGSGI